MKEGVNLSIPLFDVKNTSLDFTNLVHFSSSNVWKTRLPSLSSHQYVTDVIISWQEVAGDQKETPFPTALSVEVPLSKALILWSSLIVPTASLHYRRVDARNRSQP